MITELEVKHLIKEGQMSVVERFWLEHEHAGIMEEKEEMKYANQVRNRFGKCQTKKSRRVKK